MLKLVPTFLPTVLMKHATAVSNSHRSRLDLSKAGAKAPNKTVFLSEPFWKTGFFAGFDKVLRIDPW